MTQPDDPTSAPSTAKARRDRHTAAAFQERIAAARQPDRQAAARLAEDEATLQRELTAPTADDVAHPVRRERERRRAKLQERTLRLLTRDQEGVRLALAQKTPLTALMVADQPTALHATVVLCWPDRRPEDRQDEQTHDPDASGSGPVVLLSPEPEVGFQRFDRYDERSLIENRVNRDAKQHFALGTSLARTPEAFLTATVFSTLALVFHRSLALHRERMVEHLDRRGEPLGVLRYRRQCALLNHDRLIVVVGDRYGIYRLTEFARLAGIPLR
jgi:hypothetical protein